MKKKVRLVDANVLRDEIESLHVTVTGIASQVSPEILREYEHHIKVSVLQIVDDARSYSNFEED